MALLYNIERFLGPCLPCPQIHSFHYHHRWCCRRRHQHHGMMIHFIQSILTHFTRNTLYIAKSTRTITGRNIIFQDISPYLLLPGHLHTLFRTLFTIQPPRAVIHCVGEVLGHLNSNPSAAVSFWPTIIHGPEKSGFPCSMAVVFIFPVWLRWTASQEDKHRPRDRRRVWIHFFSTNRFSKHTSGSRREQVERYQRDRC